MHFPRSLPLNKVLLFLYWCFHSSCWCTFSGFRGQCTLQSSDLQTLLHKGSLALQVLLNINLTFSINSLREWKTHISLGGCLTCQLQGKREGTGMSLLPALNASSLQSHPTNTVTTNLLVFQTLLQLPKPTAKMLESSCVGGLLFWACYVAGDRPGHLCPEKLSMDVSGWWLPKVSDHSKTQIKL